MMQEDAFFTRHQEKPQNSPTKMTTYKIVSLGAKFPGSCVCCGEQTGSRPFELADTLLVKSPEGKFGVAHPTCAGVKTKGGIGGGRKIASGPVTVVTTYKTKLATSR